MEIDPSTLSPGERYKLMIGMITPRPIAMVGTRSAGGRDNLAPYSFFTGVGADPFTLLFCPANNSDGSEKDSLRNARLPEEGGTGEFTVSVAVESYAQKVAAASEALPFGESEFDRSGFTPTPAAVVSAPRILESPVGFECRTLQVVSPRPPGTAVASPGGPNIVIAEVVHLWIDEGVADAKGRVDQDKLRTIGRMGAARYARTTDQFEMKRP